MDFAQLMERFEDVLSLTHLAQLATIDARGYPRLRWMTPTTLRGLPGKLYAVTSPKYAKIAEIAAHPGVSWTAQSKTLESIFELFGKAYVVEDPLLKTGVLEAIGPNLQVFWRLNHSAHDLVVIETVIEEIALFLPMEEKVLRAEAPRD